MVVIPAFSKPPTIGAGGQGTRVQTRMPACFNSSVHVLAVYTVLMN